MDDDSSYTSSGASSAKSVELIELPVDIRMMIYNYLTLSELMDSVLKLSKTEKQAIIESLQKHTEF